MSNKDASKALDNALTHVNEERRGFLKTLLIGSAAVAVLPLITSSVAAQQDNGKGKADDDAAKGKGKGGKGKGKGKADGDAAPAGQ